MNTRILVLILLVVSALSVSIAASLLLDIPVPRGLKELAVYYVSNTIRDTGSPEAVAAIVWDYRGLDTIYETLVLYLAIVGGLAIFRVTLKTITKTPIGLTLFSKTSTKIISLLIATISAAITFHGHLTPGGGFPGGSALAVAAMLIIPVFSMYALLEKGVTSTKLVALRGFALTAIGLVALLPVVRGLEIVTNQKFYPTQILGIPVGGSISLYNIFESIAVASGFIAIALYLSIPEEAYKTGESSA